MYIYITFAVIPLVAHIVSCEYTKEPPKDINQVKSTLKTTVDDSTSIAPSNTNNHGYLWDKTPTSYLSNQPQNWGENIKRYQMLLKAPHSLTKLAKTLSLGFDPSFNKDYFEPFERRLRPVTLVAFRKKGYAIRNNVKVAAAVDDLDDTLKQALFLIKLLKSDFAKSLRTNDDIVANSTDDENITCSLPPEEFNSTVAMNKTEATTDLKGSPMTPSTPLTPPATMPDTSLKPLPPNVIPPVAPVMMPYASWPPMPMGYPPPSGPGQPNFPDEHYRFPYRISRRRMIPDYYYFDPPGRGNYRRLGYDPAGDLGNIPVTTQAQTTSSLSAASNEATTLHVEETAASITLTQLPTSILSITEQNHLRINSVSDLSNQTTLTTTAKSILSTATTKKQSILPTTEEPTLPRKKKQPKKRTRLLVSKSKHKKSTRSLVSKQPKHKKRTRLLVSKATTTVMSKRIENHLTGSYLRHQTIITNITEKRAKDVEMSQVATELIEELEGTNSEDIQERYKDRKDQILKKIMKNTTITTPRTTTTMKVFLQGSTRMPIPFPENNAFCHFHPENSLCSAI